MNEGLVQAQLNDGWSLLCDLHIDGYRNNFPRYPDNPGAYFRKMSYPETWETCFLEKYYDFQLFDNSLIQFRIERGETINLNYSYYECPYDSMTYKEFLSDLETSFSESGDEFRQEYEVYLSSCNIKGSVTPIRYDYSPSQYHEGRHPVSHLHLGHSSHIRLATKKILKPLSFLLLITRQFYPDVWTKFHEHPNANILYRNVRTNLETVGEEFWNTLDDCEMVLL